MPALLSSFISPTVSLLALYHTDVPGPISHSSSYAPAPSTLLKYLATTILTVHSLHHVISRKRAGERSHVEPSFGLGENVEGVLQGLGANGMTGLVFEMEHRRKSGRGVKEWYFMPYQSELGSVPVGKTRETISLLEDHPDYRPTSDLSANTGGDGSEQTTFELGLTDKQRQDRDGVELPYFDAQKGGGEGGRILYDMGSEDDFDEEEDEI